MTDSLTLDSRLGSDFNPTALERLHALDPSGQAGLVRRLFGLFASVLEQQGQRLRTAGQAGEYEVVRACAHSLRSSSLSVGAESFAAQCQALERQIVQSELQLQDLQARAGALAQAADALRWQVAVALEDRRA